MLKKKKEVIKRNSLLFILLLITVLSIPLLIEKDSKANNQKLLATQILNHYDILVKTNKVSKIYTYNGKRYVESGKIGINQIIYLSNQVLTYNNIYYKIVNFDGDYYISYEDVVPIEENIKIDDRYRNYIPFNESIVINGKVNFYDKDDNMVYNLNLNKTFPILIKYDDYYGIEYNNMLLKIKKEDISHIIEENNSSLIPISSIAVLNYHFFYDETKENEKKDCNQMICHSKKQFKSHLAYIKDNNIFTPTMEEFELFLDKKINLPKSVLITIDDGWRMQQGIDLLEEYQLNGTVFLITSWFKDIPFLNDYKYVEFHSHGDKLHDVGVCPGGQGGAIKCLSKEKLLADLALSRQKLNGSKVFCYPFYEYNNYSIEVLKEAGFKLAFTGGEYSTTPESNKYKLPRYVITNNTSVEQLKKIIG